MRITVGPGSYSSRSQWCSANNRSVGQLALAILVLLAVGACNHDVDPRLPSYETSGPIGLQGCFTEGPDHARVTVVEFVDLQCPFCNRVQPTMAKLKEKYGNDMKLYVCAHPLAMHRRAWPAAKAVLAAGRQGKYIEYFSAVLEDYRNLEDSDLLRLASRLRLDIPLFQSDMQDPDLDASLTHQVAMAESLGATGTPGFFINGQLVMGARSFEDFDATLASEMNQADILLREGTTLADVHQVRSEQQNPAYSRAVFQGQLPPPKPADKKAAQPREPTFVSEVVELPINFSPTLGTGDKVVITMFTDFQCPFCSGAAQALVKVQEHYGQSATLVFKNFPLAFHENAFGAAEAALAAHGQGRFWEYALMLYQNQRALDRASLEAYAQRIGLDMLRFKVDMDAGLLAGRIKEDMALGEKVGVAGTPTVFVNGRLLQGPRNDPDAIIRAIDRDILGK